MVARPLRRRDRSRRFVVGATLVVALGGVSGAGRTADERRGGGVAMAVMAVLCDEKGVGRPRRCCAGMWPGPARPRATTTACTPAAQGNHKGCPYGLFAEPPSFPQTRESRGVGGCRGAAAFGRRFALTLGTPLYLPLGRGGNELAGEGIVVAVWGCCGEFRASPACFARVPFALRRGGFRPNLILCVVVRTARLSLYIGKRESVVSGVGVSGVGM